MSDTLSHPTHHMAAARHVVAAYHHFQAVAALNSCGHDQAQSHAANADAESAAVHKCSRWRGSNPTKKSSQRLETNDLIGGPLR